MKNRYSTPETEIVRFEMNDVIRTSEVGSAPKFNGGPGVPQNATPFSKWDSWKN